MGSATACPSTASVTVRSPRSRARSRAVVGQDRDSSGSERQLWRTTMERSKASTRRCAIYTRKSSEEGLEQDFNSLHAQREACEAFIKSQAGEGWRLVKTAYDDGGLSGGTMERPALQQLLTDIGEGLVDIIVVYKVDRLTRSLTDFAKMVEVFDAHGVSFVAVTQQFNTTSSMGRLTLNVLLSFAQFEREVTGERIRDKIAASKQKGMWMGGLVPLGYEVRERRLMVNQSEAETVRGDLSAIPGTRLRSTVDGRAESSRHFALKYAWQRTGKLVLPWRALCAAFESHLYRRDSSQGCPPSGSARTDCRSRAVGENAAVAA